MEENTKKKYVIDASFVLSHLMPDELSEEATLFFLKYKTKKIEFITTTLLLYELANSFSSNIKRNRISPSEANRLLDLYQDYRIVEYSVNLKEVLKLSFKYNISCYDSSYIWLSKEKKAKFLTFDSQLKSINL